MSKQPTKPGFYWAKWITAVPRTHEGDELTPGNDWEVVEVWENFLGEPCEADATEKFGVSVPGVREAQWLHNFKWGPGPIPFVNRMPKQEGIVMNMDSDESVYSQGLARILELRIVSVTDDSAFTALVDLVAAEYQKVKSTKGSGPYLEIESFRVTEEKSNKTTVHSTMRGIWEDMVQCRLEGKPIRKGLMEQPYRYLALVVIDCIIDLLRGKV